MQHYAEKQYISSDYNKMTHKGNNNSIIAIYGKNYKYPTVDLPTVGILPKNINILIII